MRSFLAAVLLCAACSSARQPARPSSPAAPVVLRVDEYEPDAGQPDSPPGCRMPPETVRYLSYFPPDGGNVQPPPSGISYTDSELLDCNLIFFVHCRRVFDQFVRDQLSNVEPVLRGRLIRECLERYGGIQRGPAIVDAGVPLISGPSA